MSDQLYDVPINFKVYAKSEGEADAFVKKAAKYGIAASGLERFIIQYDTFEFLPAGENKASGKSCCGGCRN